MKKNTRVKQILTSGFLCLFLLSAVYTPAFPTEKAHAQFQETVTSCASSGIISGASSLAAAAVAAGALTVPVTDGVNTGVSAVKEYVLDCVANGLSQAALKELNDNVIDWVNGSGLGDRKFVTDYADHFLDRANESQKVFIDQFESDTNLPEPMKRDVAIALLKDRVKKQGEGVGDQLKDTFSDRFSDFVKGDEEGEDEEGDGDFTAGGWEAYGSYLENNTFAQYLKAQNLKDEEEQEARENAQTALVNNRGFINVRTCVEQTENGNCEQYQVDTPGTLIETQLNNVLGSSVDKIEVADELNEVITAYLTATFTDLFGGSAGAGSLRSGPADVDEDDSPLVAIERQVLENRLEAAQNQNLTTAQRTQVEDFLNQLESAEAGSDAVGEIREAFDTFEENNNLGAIEDINDAVDDLDEEGGDPPLPPPPPNPGEPN